ncbi:MAG: hypothetical protein RR846_01820 [Oscillospiraceae bacterium]
MKTYTIIGGVNGCGKSSLTGSLKIALRDMGIIIDPYKMAADMGCDNYEAGKLAIERMEQCLETGVCFTQESTLAGGYTKKLAAKAVEKGYYVRLYYVGLDTKEECVKRIAHRVANGGHAIDTKDVERRFLGRFKALQGVLAYCNEAVFMDNRNGFVPVGEYRNGELIALTKYPPLWLQEMMKYLEE